MNLINNSPDPTITDEVESFDYKFKNLQHERSNFTKTCSYSPYSSNGEQETNNNNLDSQLLKGHICSSELSNQFFSKCNIHHIQELLKQNIYILSNKTHVIGPQSEIELLIIMRHLYLNNAKNKNINIINQINELNDLVIKKCVPFILTKLEQRKEYIKDISSSLKIMEHPKNVNSSSTRTSLLGSSKQLLDKIY